MNPSCRPVMLQIIFNRLEISYLSSDSKNVLCLHCGIRKNVCTQENMLGKFRALFNLYLEVNEYMKTEKLTKVPFGFAMVFRFLKFEIRNLVPPQVLEAITTIFQMKYDDWSFSKRNNPISNEWAYGECSILERVISEEDEWERTVKVCKTYQLELNIEESLRQISMAYDIDSLTHYRYVLGDGYSKDSKNEADAKRLIYLNYLISKHLDVFKGPNNN